MFKSFNEGYLERQKQNKELLTYINKSTLVSIPITVIILIFYPILQVGLTERYTISAFIISYAALILYLALKIFQIKRAPVLPVYLELLAYGLLHISGGVGIIFILGFQHPVSIFWIMVIMLGYINFGRFGFVLTVLLFGLMAILDFIIYGSSDLSYLLASSTLFSVIVISSLSVARLQNLTVSKNEALIVSRREERKQRNSLSAVINNLNDAIIATDSKFNIRIFNAAAINLLDTNLDITGTSLDSTVPIVTSAGKKMNLSTLLSKSKRVETNDSLFMNISEERLRLEITYTPIRDSHSSNERNMRNGYVIILRDVTKAKSLEEERDEFISVVSHELRTPIAIAEGAIGNAQLIFSRDRSKKEIIEKTLNTAHDQVIFLSKMVNDLSTLSRAERGVADEPEVIDVSDLAHGLLDEYKLEAERQGLILNLSAHGDLGSIKTSRLYTQELLQNFITNSIKYTKIGSVDISVSKKKEMVIFSVSDTGIGISKTDLNKIFQKFYRSEDYRTRETGGTGLGLYVAEKLSKKIGTTIVVTSRLNHGSTFSFSIPSYTSEKPATSRH